MYMAEESFMFNTQYLLYGIKDPTPKQIRDSVLFNLQNMYGYVDPIVESLLNDSVLRSFRELAAEMVNSVDEKVIKSVERDLINCKIREVYHTINLKPPARVKPAVNSNNMIFLFFLILIIGFALSTTLLKKKSILGGSMDKDFEFMV